MNLLTRNWDTTPEVLALHTLLRQHGFFLITFPAETAPFQCGGGGPVPARALVSMLSPVGLLNWAEADTFTSGIPVTDIVDYWSVTDAYQIGLAAPVRAEVYRYGEQERGTGRRDLTMTDLLDPHAAARKLARYSLLERLSQHSRRLS